MSGVLGAFAGCEHSSATGSSHRRNTMTIHGAGSTFAAPLYQQWAQEFHELHPDVTLEYDSVGSGEGQKRFLANVVDFGASDAALTDDQIEHVQRGVQLILWPPARLCSPTTCQARPTASIYRNV